MLKSKLLIGVLGITTLLIPQQLSNGKTVSEFMETDIKTRTIEERKVDTDTDLKQIKSRNVETPVTKQVEFVSIQQEEVVEVIETKEEFKEYIGKFTITYYCSCELCNGKWAGFPATNGEPLKEGYTIAVDPNVIPLNTRVYIDGIGYRNASDTGSSIKGNKIDIYVNGHELAYKLGVTKDVQVWIKDKR